MTNDLTAIGIGIIGRFDAVNRIRDEALGEGRQLVRLAATAIRALHRGETAEAESLLEDGRRRMGALADRLADHPSIYWAGYVQDSMKEIAEACIVEAIHGGKVLPSPDELGVEDAAYLNGLAEAASELRRDVLDELRGDRLDRAVRYLEAMDAIYALLVSIDFPDAITGGLRRSTDQLRGVLERTRGDLTLTLNQRRLEAAIRSIEPAETG